ALSLSGHDAARVENGVCDVPDGAFTVECWINAEAFAQRNGLICKTEDAEYGLFVNAARPEFLVFLDRGYVSGRAAQPILKVGWWHHLGGVVDGAEVRLYVDGVKVAAAPGKGERKRNQLPLMLGADVGATGGANSYFKGKLDAVRVSKGALYAGDKFEPA